MKRRIRMITALCLAGLLAVSIAGCGNKANSEQEAARVNSTVITEGDLYVYTMLKLCREGYDLSEMDRAQEKSSLEEMVNAEAIRQQYSKNGVEIYDDSYNAAKESYLEEMQSGYGEFLEQNDISEEDLIRAFRVQYINSRFFEETQNAYNSDQITEEARKYYEAHKKSYAIEKEKRISMILTEKKKEAEEVLERLAAGEDFSTLAQQLSIDENSAASGGDLGFFTKSEVLERFGKGVFGLKTGEVTAKPVHTADGWAVLQITDYNDSGYRSFDEVSQDIIYSLYENYNKERLNSIKKKMKIRGV